MWFIGLVIGAAIGAALGGFPGSLACGFIGWVVGLLMSTRKDAPATQSVSSPNDFAANLEQRLGAIERRLAALESALIEWNGAKDTGKPSDVPTRGTQAVGTNGARSETAIAADIVSNKIVPRTVEDVTTGQAVPADESIVAAAPPHPEPPNFIVAWFSGVNAIVRFGVVILFIGLTFLVKYAVDHTHFPLELRLATAAAFAFVLLVVGWRLRERRPGYALTLQGAGVGVLYLTIFGAFRLWRLLPPELAFALLAAVAVLTAVLAVKQDALALAVAGFAGGFLAPILTSSGGGNHVMLFSYFAILNAGIFAIAWFKSWRPLNLVGFVFTFAIGALWGAQYYRTDKFESTEPFLILFFLIYVGNALLFALRQAPRLNHYVDGTLIFGTPLIGFGMQAALVKDFEYGLAISSLVLAMLYLSLAKILFARKRETLRLLVESFLALGVIFATLTIPLALDARWTSAFWALEGTAVLWAGMRQERLLARQFGLLLQLVAGLAFFHGYAIASVPYPMVNSIFIGAVLLAGTGILSSRMLSRDVRLVSTFETALAPLMFLWGLAWWLYAGLRELHRFIEHDFQIAVALVFLTATALVFNLLHRRLDWREAAWPMFAFLPVLVFTALIGVIEHGHPFANYGWLAWAAALASHFAILRASDPPEPGPALALIHAGSLILLAALGAWEMHWLTGEYGLRRSAWSAASVIAIPGLLLLGVVSARMRDSWPVSIYTQSYLVTGAMPIIVAIWLWTFYANLIHDGTSLPLPYLPLVNAIDVGHVFVLLVFVTWMRRVNDGAGPGIPLERGFVYAAGGVSAFVWLNAIVLRSIHHWAGVAYDLASMANSVLVQTTLSIFWTFLALLLMFIATRKHFRPVWMVGAALMGIVVVKLFLVDWSGIGGIERIVSFVGVGLLMVVIGYFSPLPPAAKKEVSQ